MITNHVHGWLLQKIIVIYDNIKSLFDKTKSNDFVAISTQRNHKPFTYVINGHHFGSDP